MLGLENFRAQDLGSEYRVFGASDMSVGLFLYKGLSNCREAAAQGSVIEGIRVY